MTWTPPWRACAVMLALLACGLGAFADDRAPANPNAGSLLDDKGCKFVNPYPKAAETVSWTGGCVDGWAEGEGTAQWSTEGKPGQRYVGAMVRGMYEGHGALHMFDGSEYEGNFVRGLLQGEGRATWSNGNRYEGHFIDGERTGRGVFTWSTGSSYEGDFLEGRRTGKGKYRMANGGTYEGGFFDGNPAGHGLWRLASGETFEGRFRFVNGLAEGDGVQTSRNGDTAEGHFIKGKLDGHGVGHNADGSVSFEGEFVAGEPKGPVALRGPDGKSPKFRTGQVCTKLVNPEMPKVGKWSGYARYKAFMFITAGKVTRVDVKPMVTAGDEETDHLFAAAIETALRAYECPGDHIGVQEFQFKDR